MMVVFVVASLVLLPRQTSDWLGLEELGVLGGECAFLLWDFRRTRKAVASRRWGLTFLRPYQLRTTLAVGVALVGMVGAALVWAGWEAGFYLLAGFSVVTMVWVVINTWALVLGITDEADSSDSAEAQ